MGNMGVTHGKKASHSEQNLSSGCAQPLIGPDSGCDLGSGLCSDQRWDRDEELDQNQPLVEHVDEGYYEELIRPKKLPNPVKASRSHRELHRELLITHKRGAVVEEKPELQRVLEQRNRALALRQEREEQEERKKQRSPLEQELLRRQQRLERLEKEMEEERERRKRAPEFIRVKESLKRTAVANAVEKEL
ncbi:actin-associated protein FAM107A [Astyanax mexicanus]|uniref:Actin-associated protein FAM107A n=2 Tax=Astyanax mexicanus TaxID=7994 RepID=A0A8T2M4U8_ASTMX|nr:actin-associated protein FAM107A [Astyanax mexicanus]KAG9277002.1 protein FAM107B-like [Astyanax mexicanus]